MRKFLAYPQSFIASVLPFLIPFGIGSISASAQNPPSPTTLNSKDVLAYRVLFRRVVGYQQIADDAAVECPASFVPVEMRQTGTRGAIYGTREEAHSGADCEPAAAG
jgi:hypothetical protein